MTPSSPAPGGFRRLALALAALLLLAGAAAAPAAAAVRILAFGDSLTAGSGLPPAQGFTAQLEAWLHAHGAPDATVANAGVPGETTGEGLARISRTLGPPGDPRFDAVIVELGGNDMLDRLDLADMRRNLDGILTEIGRRDLPVLLAGLPASPTYPAAWRREFKATYRDLARRHGAIYVSSFFAGMAEGRSVPEIMALFQPDGLHPNAAGVAAIVEGIGPAVLKLVERARPMTR
ncbi:arylesterase [Amaricoccus sp.]|uniref:arylesterase n=1 Tax=Amaricoccus sp. TaxID=1872485 RepID=UPI002634375E|nr:arylesterase [Amaricoccus sp.]HRO10126.1 arylesterase [Amaricoccus sp.]